MKKDNVIKFLICLIVIVAVAYFAIFGLKIGDKKIINDIADLKTGLDISGGVSIVYQATSDDGSEITADDLKKSEAVIKKRLEAKNIFDYYVRQDVASSRIYVEIPADITDTSADPLTAVEGLDKTAKIEFRDSEGNILLSGDDIASAKYSDDPVDYSGMPSPHVVLNFSEEGAKKFADATEKLVGKTLAIYLDEEELMAPQVNEKIESDTAIITLGGSSFAEKKAQAQEYAMLIDSGALPFSLEIITKEYVGPYIGQKALEVSAYVAIISVIAIAVIMIIAYRLPGALASLSLVAYVGIIINIMAQLGISLTLPGIAGLILSLGMAVDANVIIFERLKEELKSNISPLKAFERSFKNAMAAVVDGNITTFIVALLLYIFGTGTIKGFGITLAIGVLSSLVTAVLITKYLLKQFMPLASKHRWLFGLKKEEE